MNESGFIAVIISLIGAHVLSSIDGQHFLLSPFDGEAARCRLYFHTLTMPSLEEVTMKPCVVWKVAMSVMMSWCPTGTDSGPRRGESSTTPLFCLLWISCRSELRRLQKQSVRFDQNRPGANAYLDHFSSLDDLPAVEDRRAVQRVVGSSCHNVRPVRIRQVPEPETTTNRQVWFNPFTTAAKLSHGYLVGGVSTALIMDLFQLF